MKKILIVEDEKVLAEMYQDKFTQAGFRVVLTDTAEEAIKIVVKEKPDLVLLDILLPKKNGIDFLKRLRQNPKVSSTLVVAFSNFDDPETKKEAAKLGVKDYLIKTAYTPQGIVEKVRSYFK